MILCFYQQEHKTFKENHKIIDVPFSSSVDMGTGKFVWPFDDDLLPGVWCGSL
jgi:hypothetical protein